MVRRIRSILSRIWHKLERTVISKELSYVLAFSRSLKSMRINDSTPFFYPFDPSKRRTTPAGTTILCSNTVDYSVVLLSDLNDIKRTIRRNCKLGFRVHSLILITVIESFARRHAKYFHTELLYSEPVSLKDAIQKLLFYNALFWQAGHWHVGLGRLDFVLNKYYLNDLEQGHITPDGAKMLISEMLKVLNKDMKEKSGEISGDTGQYIIIGGIDEDGNTVENELTSVFLNVFKDYDKPDPKLILRASHLSSDTIISFASETILSGKGSPLIVNDSVVLPSMQSFGYESKDVYNMGTSACWEPLIIGKSFDQNNSLPSIVALKALDQTIHFSVTFETFDALLSSFLDNLCELIKRVCHDISFDCSPLYSLFFDDCIGRSKDYSRGGAKYSFHGLQIVSLPNTVNALLNIKRFVFDNQLFSLEDCVSAIDSDYSGYEDIRQVLLRNDLRFGNPHSDVVSLTRVITQFVDDVVSSLQINGNKVKVGFSSPNYINEAHSFPASLDGRHKGEPFAVHISPVSDGVDLLGIIDFASCLDYSNCRINGNVVDFIIPPAYQSKPEVLASIIKSALDKGVFEMQLNILDYDTLVDAVKHPEKHSGLIVRVWGFSAFFNDLPDEYKQALITRARAYAS